MPGRVPPPGDQVDYGHNITSDQAITELRRRLTDGGPDRRGRYWAAMVSGPNALDAVLRLVDEDLEQARAGDSGANVIPAEIATSDDRKAVERAVDLATTWETLDPVSLMSRRRASAILLEVLQPFTPRPAGDGS